jgi:hypothetical protein
MAKIEKGGFVFGKAVFRTPPKVVSGFFLGGGGSVGIGSHHVEGGWFCKTIIPDPPPLVKVRMVRGGGGPEFLLCVDLNT